MTQQTETLAYFREHADSWRANAERDDPDFVNIVGQRNACVMHWLETMGVVNNFLDIGCGSGELVLDAAGKTTNAIGIDFADTMIEKCHENNLLKKADNVQFHVASVFDYEPKPESVDLLSAQGFIEYISLKELQKFLADAARWVAPGGCIAIGSRNRLYNLFSLNSYTQIEIDIGSVNALLGEAIKLGGAKSQQEAIEKLSEHDIELPMPEQHPGTGIKVTTRHQYTPGQLMTLFRRAGFETEAIYHANYHAMPIAAKDQYTESYGNFANHVFAEYPLDPRLVPNSSTFEIVARKATSL